MTELWIMRGVERERIVVPTSTVGTTVRSLKDVTILSSRPIR